MTPNRSTHKEDAVSLDDLGAAQRKDPGQCLVRRVKAWDPRVDALRQRMSLLGWLSLLVLLSVIWAMVLKPTL